MSPTTSPEAPASTAPASRNPLRRARLTTRDLISVGIFTALYFAIVFVFAMAGFLGPLVMFGGFALGVVLNGLVIALLIARTPRFGALGLVGVLSGVLLVLSGQAWYVPVIGLLLGLLADLIVTSGSVARLPARIPLAYAVLSLAASVAPMGPLYLATEDYLEITVQQMGQEYADGLAALANPWFLLVWTVVAFALGLLGGWLGVRANRKHFVRAGLA
jgi:energy-coupling factor transport system substrate-specific component